MATEQERPTASCVFLVGFMGAGKTTVGQLLARRLQWSFVDLDDRVRAREGREIAEIFHDAGEPYFRQVESECLQELVAEIQTAGNTPTLPGETRARPERGNRNWLAAEEGFVVALGGGAFVQAGNALLLRHTGAPVIFLDATVDELRRRCCASGGAERPLLRDQNLFGQLYEARRGGYMTADFRLDTGGKTPEQVVEEILALNL